MAVVKFEKNGQGFYDFDALLKSTSEEFVNLISSKIEFYEKHDFDLRIKLDADKVSPTVYMYHEDVVHVFRYYGNGLYRDITLSKWDVEEMLGELHG